MVIHGGIDGYSQSIVYLHCSDNNKAMTVFQRFREAVLSYGLPSRVQSDCGGENVCVIAHACTRLCIDNTINDYDCYARSSNERQLHEEMVLFEESVPIFE